MNTVASPVLFGTQSEFASAQGWGKPYVSKLKSEGRLVFNAAGLVDFAASLARIKATSGAPERAAPQVQGAEYESAMDRQRHWEAEKSRIVVQQMVLELRSAEEVRSQSANAYKAIRARLEMLPDTLAPQLASLGGDEKRISAVLAERVDNLVHQLRLDMVGLMEQAKN